MALQEFIDRTLPLRRAVFRLLDRPALRGVLGGGVSVYSFVRRGRGVLVSPSDGLWVHRFATGYLVNRVIDTTLLETIDEVVRDYFLHRLELRAGDVVVDVGAGIGTEVLTFSRLVGPTGRIVAIEAHPETARCLRRTCDLNRLSQVAVVSAAATESPCELSITDDEDHIRSQLRSGSDGAGHRVVGVPLASILADHGITRVDLLKMNIEGAELQALRGLGDAFAGVRQVAIACHDFLDESNDPSDWRRTLEPVRALLEREGFEVWQRPDEPRPWVSHTLYGRRR